MLVRNCEIEDNCYSQRRATKEVDCAIADGVCHIYIDNSANLDMARSIVLDEKINYPDTSNTVVSNYCPFDLYNFLFSVF